MQALLRHKVSPDEDAVTGALFGALQFLPDSIVRELFSTTPRTIKGTKSKLALSEPLEWCFWPDWLTGEPDVVVADRGNVCPIEVKLWADFGQHEDGEYQLECHWREGSSRRDGKALWLLIVTADSVAPWSTIEQQLPNVKGSEWERVLWMGWTDMARALKDRSDHKRWPELQAIVRVIGLIGLAPFDGFSEWERIAADWNSSGRAIWEFKTEA